MGVVRLALASLARNAGLEEETVDDLKIAISEACTNAVEANEASDEPVQISWDADEARVQIEVEDRRPAVESSPSGVDTQGFSTRHTMSLALLETLADEFELSPRAGGGLSTRLVFQL